MLIVQKLK